jgi:MinD-like ATPase involved in chromosome partitioning or flagellar assembly
VADDQPIEALLPLLVDACGVDDTATWALRPRGSGPIDSRRTLREAGVWHGAILGLQQAEPGERPADVIDGAEAAGPPRQLSRWRRAGIATSSALGRPRAGAGRGPVARARAAWRATDRVAWLERSIAAAARPHGVTIAVASIAPGCGRTTVTALLAALLTSVRPPGVALLPAPGGSARALDATACTTLIARLRAEGELVLLDCPAGFSNPWGQAAWAAADQFVLVAEDRAGDLAALARVASTLAGAGLPVAVVANRSRPWEPTTFARQAALPGTLVALPEHEAAAAELREGRLAWDAAPQGWRIAIAELASALSRTWA